MTGDWLPRDHTTINHYLLSLTEIIMKDLTETLEAKIEHRMNKNIGFRPSIKSENPTLHMPLLVL